MPVELLLMHFLKRKRKLKRQKNLPPELEERQKCASARMTEFATLIEIRMIIYVCLDRNKTFFVILKEGAKEGKQCCPVPHQLKAADNRTHQREIHRVLGRSNEVWCRYSDDKTILD